MISLSHANIEIQENGYTQLTKWTKMRYDQWNCYHMDFEVENITVYSTRHYDNPQAALNEADYHSEDILDKISGRSDYLYYAANSDEGAVKSFEDWMRRIALSLNDLETRGLVSIKDRDVAVYLWRNDVKSRFFPSKMLPRRRNA